MKISTISYFINGRAALPRRLELMGNGAALPYHKALLFILFLVGNISASAQIQQAWVARYNNGMPSGTNQAVKMALDSAGNVYVTGVSENTNANLDYATMKYAPSGNVLWANRYDSTSHPTASPWAMALDSSNDVVVTGSAVTIEYGPKGSSLWTAPYNASAVGVDASNNVYITGVASNFETIKLNSQGSNQWVEIEQGGGSGPQNEALGIVVDSAADVFVAGNLIRSYGPGESYPDVYLRAVKYNTTGLLQWTNNLFLSLASDGGTFIGVGGMVLDGQSNLFVSTGQQGVVAGAQYATFNVAGTSGGLLWSAYPDSNNGYNRIYGLVVGSNRNVFSAGQVFNWYPVTNAIGTMALNSDGSTAWLNLYPPAFTGNGGGYAIALDSANNVYVTGFALGTNGKTNIVTIKYSGSGTQLWLQRYVAPGGGNAIGNNIAVDAGGNVYVAGYESTPQGGTEMVLIKYAPVTVQRRADGTVLLQAQGAPNETFDVEASADLQSWQDLGQFPADTNGLFQFDDTNAVAYPARFYATIPQ